MIKASYRAFVRVCTLCVELMRQFYTVPRCFRVVGQRGAAQFLSYDNSGLRPRPQGYDFGVDLGVRVPVFDIVVKAQKASPFAVVAQNELAKEFYSAGFFQPQMADQAMACLDMMSFDGKEQVVERIAQNATLSVSYTHLDVYKRKPQCSTGGCWGAGSCPSAGTWRRWRNALDWTR